MQIYHKIYLTVILLRHFFDVGDKKKAKLFLSQSSKSKCLFNC